MPPFLDLPGELRNEIYYAVYDNDHTVHIASDGAIRLPALAHVSSQVRREALSIFEDMITRPDTIKATIRDLDFSQLTSFLQARPDLDPRRVHVDLTVRFLKAEACSDAITRLEDFARLDFRAVQCQAEFDWRAYDIGSAARMIHALATRPAGNAGVLRSLTGAMAIARQLQVKRSLVERPARQRLQISNAGMDFRLLRME